MTKQFLDVAYEDRDLAKRLGARWDPSVRKWYCTKGSALAKIFDWRAAPKNSSTAQSLVAAHNAAAPRISSPMQAQTSQLQFAI